MKKDPDWKRFLKLFTNAKSDDMIDQLFQFFLTINERDFLVNRYKITKELLTSGLTQREIADKLNVSIAKITAGSNELKRTSNDLKLFITKNAKKK